MPGVDLEKVYADPEFQGMSDADQKAVLHELGYEGGGDDEWKKAGEAIKAALSGGGKEQMSARDMAAMGYGGAAANPMVQHAHDNPGEAVADTAMMMAGPMAGPAGGAVRAVAGKAAPMLGRALPRVQGAVSGATQGYTMGDLPGAVVGGVVGAVTGKGPTELIAGGIGKVAQAAKAVGPAAQAVKAAGGHTKDVQALFTMAKEAGKEFKKGEKVWILLKDGKASKILTPDQAGAAARAGQKTTWVKNLWN